MNSGSQYSAMSPVATTLVVMATAPDTYSGTPATFLSCAPKMTKSVGIKARLCRLTSWDRGRR